MLWLLWLGLFFCQGGYELIGVCIGIPCIWKLPRTICELFILSLCYVEMKSSGEEMQHLVSALSSEADMTLKHSTVLGGTEVCTGMTLLALLNEMLRFEED